NRLSLREACKPYAFNDIPPLLWLPAAGPGASIAVYASRCVKIPRLQESRTGFSRFGRKPFSMTDTTPTQTDTPAVTFSSFGLHPSILLAVAETGYTIPTPIQAQAMPIVMDGRDVMGAAQTGTG